MLGKCSTPELHQFYHSQTVLSFIWLGEDSEGLVLGSSCDLTDAKEQIEQYFVKEGTVISVFSKCCSIIKSATKSNQLGFVLAL